MKKRIIILGLVFMGSLILFVDCSMNKITYTTTSTGIKYKVNGVTKQIQFYDDNALRVTVSKHDSVALDKSLVVIQKSKPANWTVKETVTKLLLQTKTIKLEISRSTGAIKFFDIQNKIFLKENEEKPFVFFDSIHTFAIKQNFQLTDKEGIYGLGQFQNQYMNYRNKELLLVQANRIAIVPFLISTQNYGILWDNYSKSVFKDSTDGASFSSEIADKIDYYFVAGKNMDSVIKEYRYLTGEAPMYSKSAYGFWQSKAVYFDKDELLSVVAKYREQNIPIDNIIQDAGYWGSDFNGMVWDKQRYPDPEKFIDELHNKYHVRIMNSIWPGFGKNTAIFKEMDEKGYLLNRTTMGGGKVYDPYNAEARKLYFKYVQNGLLSKGVDALWMDGIEPELSGGVETQKHFEEEVKKSGNNALGPMASYLNTFSLMSTKSVYEGQRFEGTTKRVFSLSRSAFAGQQRYAAATWSGDISSCWDHLKKQIPAGINYSMAGTPYWTYDIGGFYPSDMGGLYPGGIDDPAFRELYVRWFQFGAFTPLFRSHGAGTPREVWQFKERDTSMYRALIKVDNLRYRLLPYIYSQAWKITNEGYTLMRGMMMDFPGDQHTYNIDGQYLFGPEILVRPVTREMYYPTKYVSLSKIPATNFVASGHSKGLDAEYFDGNDFDKKVKSEIDTIIDFRWWHLNYPIKPSGSSFSIRRTGEFIAPENGDFDFGIVTDGGVRLWIEGKLVIDSWKDQETSHFSSAKLNFEKGKHYAIKIESFHTTKNIGEIQLKLGKLSNNKFDKNEKFLVKTYLPGGIKWYDFWTGEQLNGGQDVEKESPIDILPLYIKAGSILPLGDIVQYADQKPADKIELRIYTGGDASFVLYEDENDNYNYEKGVYATIPIEWNDKDKTLTIGERKGEFPGMLKERTFNVVIVRSDHGVGIDETQKPEKIITYKGDKISVKL